MPAKPRRNGQARRHIETRPVVYPHSFSDTPSTSSASSPPDAMAAFDYEPPLFDTGPLAERETMTDVEPEFALSSYAHNLPHAADAPAVGSPAHDATVRVPRAKPTPIQTAQVYESSAEAEPEDMREHGHVRSPMLAREPTALESFSRTIRGYVPSSIPIPSVAPTPPRVSRPLSFGSFLSPSRTSSSRSGSEVGGEGTKRRGSDVSLHKPTLWQDHRTSTAETEAAVFNLDEEVMDERAESSNPARYPSTSSPDEIVWSRWDTVVDGSVSRRMLLLGYRNGLQIWDCTNLGSISEVLNLSGIEWSNVITAAILPDPPHLGAHDVFATERPLLGVCLRNPNEEDFLLYSLHSHTILRTLRLPTVTQLNASCEFIVLSTTEPAALHIFSARTLESLYIVPSSSLITFAHPLTQTTSESNNIVSLSHIEHPHNDIPHAIQATSRPQPVFTHRHRLLAYISTAPSPGSPSELPSRLPRTATPTSPADSHRKFPTNQADLGTAAVKLGGTVLSGMKVLGGMAFSAARAGVSAAAVAAERRYSAEVNPPPPPGKFVSRSAPAASPTTESSYPQHNQPPSPKAASLEPSLADREVLADRKYYVTVIDLHSLYSQPPAQRPLRVAEFMLDGSEPVSLMQFSDDGNCLVIARRDGQTMKVYQLQPQPIAARSLGRTDNLASRTTASPSTTLNPPLHMYDLRRGRTSGVVDSLTWAHDGRWIAVATQKGTVHIFASNPFGGPTHEATHLHNKVVNPQDVQPLSTELSPIVRLRNSKSVPFGTVVSKASTCTFLPRSTSLPLSLAPQYRTSQAVSYQDCLLFDARDGTLSLRRILLTKQIQSPTTSSGVSFPGHGTSASLPGVSSLGRMASSASQEVSRIPSGLSRMMARPPEIVGQDSIVATWILKRARDWADLRRPLRSSQQRKPQRHIAKSDWLSQAELSTCSRSTKIVPRSIYLAHQFSFHVLAEDYHALLRSYHFDVPATKVEVRRQIEVSGSGSGVSESFVSGSSAPSQAGFSSSFDEPLASALSGDLRGPNPSPPVLPMYPNGPAPRSLRTAIPIRHVAAGITDGMSESLGRIRREINKVRSPQLIPQRDSRSASVPLEFDEEDEDFLPLDPEDRGDRENMMSRATSREDPSVSTPSTGIEPLPADAGDATWQDWDHEDKQAVEEVEQFDDIGVGFMDEEWAENSKRR